MIYKTIKNLQEMGTRIELALKKPEAKFCDIGHEQIALFHIEAPLHDFENEVSHWVLNEDIPEQLNVYDGFGQPPLTVFNNGNFVIDLYFWMNIDTSIHSHSFSGAFKVLYGKSVHEIYKVKKQKEISSDVMISEVSLESTKVLRPGDSHKISQGLNFNHRVVHLDKPTVTLCIRTINDTDAKQWHHFTNGLSVEKKDLTPEIIKKIFYFNYLYKRNPEHSVKYLKHIIKTWDKSVLLNLYEGQSFASMGLEEESCELFFKHFRECFAGMEWFKRYEDFFLGLEESYIETSGDTSRMRFLEHALSFGYSHEIASKMTLEIEKGPLSKVEKELLKILRSRE